MAIDIGYTLFVEILRMSQYPGAPFTGDIVRDIVMFFFIPTVFIILFVFMLLGTMFPRGWPLRALTGIAIWLFIVFGGYYGVFAAIAGPYFFILIFILGGLFFLRGHIGVRVEGGAVPGIGGGHAHGPQGSENRARKLSEAYRELENMKKDIAELKALNEKTGTPIDRSLEGCLGRLSEIRQEVHRLGGDINKCEAVQRQIDGLTRAFVKKNR